VVPAASTANPPTADDLLLQIRGRVAKEEPVKLSNQSTAIFQKGEPVEVMLGTSEDAESATVMMTPDQLRAKLAAEMDEPVTPVKQVASSKADGDAMVSAQLVLPDGRTITERLPASLSAAAAVTLLAGRVVPLPLDQSGTMHSWYRLEQEGRRVGVSTSMSTLVDQPIHVVLVAGETRVVEVTVVSGGQDVRFSNPMSTVVPIYSLTAHLQEWLALPSAEWEMVFSGDVLDPHMILDDVSAADALSVQLRIAGS